MFNLSWSETFLILIIAFLIIGPEDFPKVLRWVKNVIQKIKKFGDEITDQVKEVTDESEINTIMGDDGKLYDAYDVSDIMPKIDKDEK